MESIQMRKRLFFLLTLFALPIACPSISFSQDAEDLLADYFLKYENSYSEFSLRYRGERFSKRPNATNALVRERLLLVEGIVVESVKQKFSYAGERHTCLSVAALQ
jgi:hypothetical protein